jgi:hypothetical protein
VFLGGFLIANPALRSPYAVILLIRIACKMIEEEDQDSGSPYFDFIESCLRHKVTSSPILPCHNETYILATHLLHFLFFTKFFLQKVP